MQGWFAHTIYFLPNSSVIPTWIGTHFSCVMKKKIAQLLTLNPSYFRYPVGSRDISTLSFLKGMRVESYLSRCLTLLYDKRSEDESQKANKIFFVDIPDSWIPFFPKNLTKNTRICSQKWVYVGWEHWEDSIKRAESLIESYKKEARLVVTTALHCATPCIAMGIPVVLIATDIPENTQRFSSLTGLLKIYSFEDLKTGKINFDLGRESQDFESLKFAMKENLKLSICQSMGLDVPKKELAELRKYIENFSLPLE
jgi:hypothetical protein